MPATSNLIGTTTNSDASQEFHFRSGWTCHKRADYTRASKSAGAVAIKNIFSASGSFESKWENAQHLSPKFEELAAVFFDICYQYGQGQLTKDQYEEQRRTYDLIRQRLVSGTPAPVGQPAPVARYPFNLQVQDVRERIRYLVEEELHARKLGLYEVFGPIGDHQFGPEVVLYDQRAVIRHLAEIGEVEIVSEDASNLVFLVKDKLLRR